MTGIVRGSLTDREGNWDIAYVSLAGVAIATVGPIFVMTAVSVIAYFRCVPREIIAKATEQVTIIACTYNPEPLGTAIGLAAGGFGVALGALAAYMAATRRPQGASTTTTTMTTATSPAVVPAVGTAADPLQVAVVDMPPIDKNAKGKRRAH